MLDRLKKSGFEIAVVAVALLFATDFGVRILAESLWFQEVGYLDAFWRRAIARTVLAIAVVGGTLAALLWNLRLAERLRHPDRPPEPPPDDRPPPRWWDANPRERARSVGPPLAGGSLGLKRLLLSLAAIALSLAVAILHYGRIAASYWSFGPQLPSRLPPIPPRFSPALVGQALGETIANPAAQPWAWVGLGLAALAIVAPKYWLRAIALFAALSFGLVLSRQWGAALQWLHRVPFGETDPLFHLDIGFYTFVLPVWELLEFWWVGTLVYGLASALLVYLLSGRSLSQGKFPGFSAPQMRHLCGLLGTLLWATALGFGLSCVELVYSPRGVTYGASFTDVAVELPADIVLAVAAFWSGATLLAYGLLGRRWSFRTAIARWRDPDDRRDRFSTRPPRPHRLLLGLTGYAIAVLVLGTVLPTAVQQFAVAPNELEREAPYIRRSIANTRQAFDLDAIDAETFDPRGTLTAADLSANDTTIRNIRLWDTRPLLATNRQLQQIRLYYRFASGDIDRYRFLSPEDREDGETLPEPGEPNGDRELQQAILSARELDYDAVPDRARTWVNEHLIYTHGYGFTLSPVNQAAPSGLPEYYVRDISGDPDAPDENPLRVSDPRIRATIPTQHPRLYYGELTDTYVMAPTAVRELDYPSGNENAYNHYDGAGGIALTPAWRRWLFAAYLRDWRLVLTDNFQPDTKLLFRRRIDRRIRAIAPFLRYDNDPYLVAVEAETPDSPRPESFLYWVVDAYTTSDRYPYSEPSSTGVNQSGVNYIRNAVKVVVDAYHGSARFYVADPEDPVVRVWARAFPNLFRPLETMPEALRQHVRYPTDLFQIQADQLLAYHMQDPQVFYNREDLWEIPTEIYGSDPQQVEPYYAILELPSGRSAEFVQLLPFTPVSRNNLVAWLAARSDGNNYGKLLLYQFPKDQLVFGIEQIEARINQDPEISEQISLWNRQGSRVRQGNLLVIPIETSLLYVEPLYLEAENTGLPTLVRVIVAYNDRIAMEPTLNDALASVFEQTGTGEAEDILPLLPTLELLGDPALGAPPIEVPGLDPNAAPGLSPAVEPGENPAGEPEAGE